ncbi:MAG: hypothetical protein ABWX90_02820 [Candidatus Saccharimonadales bacterium]
MERMKGPVLLHDDGTIGEIGDSDVEVTSRLPSRVAGRERIVTKVVSLMTEIAIHASLGEYVSYEKNRAKKDRYQSSSGWTLDDMPAEVLSAYETWRSSVTPDIDGIREIARTKVASSQEKQTATMPCRDCNHNSEYLCRTSGASKEFYSYPIARYQDGDTVYDVPFDVADAINRSPSVITTEVRPAFDANGDMSAQRLLIIKAQAMPKSFINGEVNDDIIQIAPGEALESDIEIVIDYWHEDVQRSDRMRQSWAHANRFSAQNKAVDSAERYLEYLQFYVAQKVYAERNDPKDYDVVLKKLRTELGRRGLGLAYQYASAGMGEMDARVMIAKETNGYIETGRVTYTDEVRDALERTLEHFQKG